MLVVDPARELKSFRVEMSTPTGTKRGRGRGAFIDSVLAAIDDFYSEVLQNLKAWSAAPPRLREPEDGAADPLDSNALSSQDGPQPADTPPALETTQSSGEPSLDEAPQP